MSDKYLSLIMNPMFFATRGNDLISIANGLLRDNKELIAKLPTSQRSDGMYVVGQMKNLKYKNNYDHALQSMMNPLQFSRDVAVIVEVIKALLLLYYTLLRRHKKISSEEKNKIKAKIIAIPIPTSSSASSTGVPPSFPPSFPPSATPPSATPPSATPPSATPPSGWTPNDDSRDPPNPPFTNTNITPYSLKDLQDLVKNIPPTTRQLLMSYTGIPVDQINNSFDLDVSDKIIGNIYGLIQNPNYLRTSNNLMKFINLVILSGITIFNETDYLFEVPGPIMRNILKNTKTTLQFIQQAGSDLHHFLGVEETTFILINIAAYLEKKDPKNFSGLYKGLFNTSYERTRLKRDEGKERVKPIGRTEQHRVRIPIIALEDFENEGYYNQALNQLDQPDWQDKFVAMKNPSPVGKPVKIIPPVRAPGKILPQAPGNVTVEERKALLESLIQKEVKRLSAPTGSLPEEAEELREIYNTEMMNSFDVPEKADERQITAGEKYFKALQKIKVGRELVGGSMYYQKYLKYKQKYLELKNKMH